MSRESRRSFALCLCFLLVGILLGILVDAEFRPNHIQFWVNQIGDLSVVFQPGDTVEWKRLTTNDPMNIQFYGASPCKQGQSNPCTIWNIPNTAVYTYSCVAQGDPNFSCNDPQGGPKSITGNGGEAPTLAVKIFDLARNILDVLRKTFGFAAHAGNPGTAQKIAGTTATEPATSSSSASGAPKASPKVQGIGVTVYCDSGTNTTFAINPQQSTNPKDPILASLGAPILWTTPSANGFTVTMNDPSTCKENVSTFGPGSVCTFEKPGSFTAVVSSTCPANTTEKLAVQ